MSGEANRPPPGIHPTAVVHPGARLGRDVAVGPYAVVEDGAVVGDRTVVGAHCVIRRGVTLGEDNRLSVGVVLGEDPQHRRYAGEVSFVRIGNRNILREYVTVNRAYGEGQATEIGDDNYLMSYVHIGHNCVIRNHVILTSGTKLAGHALVDDQANLGGQVGVHQFVRIGRLVMIGGGSVVRQDVPPFILAFGLPARAYGPNTVGLSRAGVPPVHRTMIKRAFMLLYRSGLALPTALGRVEAELGDDPYVREMVEFIRASSDRGIVRGARDGDGP
ncbi:MAG: acyl-ACP--UDP-N-acetylglucosamine O-acyltransferase [Armatimonadota bacterium]|nr:acyl-ACP--UDP-N-acetylglucosamine O-acyltransferase [Armatimonadota bacterium]MDR7401484.1 acyl-ACP--UDP-N-acetylglucosamine O-acyltransferase [Armatimonadota bacterium]MDR7404765.1 acyl-ACP--UDP-N-acetylglucosamine O-acyltransferase [Armatimonadota bacterium]MDR7437523.1 acyl-ACP--UDP-N-acetylglucosamine O-acyltransferase [Armatimonadota bacterium]MDR7471708.1 acyl-ACP--UDP-N-acetylglucosamine O-acyltransferase [Armatimonadota bacterium]